RQAPGQDRPRPQERRVHRGVQQHRVRHQEGAGRTRADRFRPLLAARAAGVLVRRAVVLVVALGACVPTPGTNPAASTADEDDAGVCSECACRAVECDADAAPGCSACEPACATDDDCLPGLHCAVGDTCEATLCVCANGLPPWDEDEAYPCCEARDENGVCCQSGLVDTATGQCVCDEPYMLDLGDGCVCPEGMEPDPDTGQCACTTAGAVADPDTGACECPPGTFEQLDDYTGSSTCAGDDDPPPACGDDNAAYDPTTGDCDCKPGYVLGNVDDSVTPYCVPAGDAGVPDGGP